MTRFYVASIMGDIPTSQAGEWAREYAGLVPEADQRSVAAIPSPLPGISILYLCNVWATDRSAAERMAALDQAQGAASRVLTSWPHDISDWPWVRTKDDPGEFHYSASSVAEMERLLVGEVAV